MKDLIVKVNNNNEYTDQDVEYFLIERTPEIIACYEKRFADIKKMSDSNLYEVTYWDGFQVLKGSFSDVMGDGDDDTAMFHTLTDEEHALYVSDARIGTHILSLQPDNSMGWKAYGKHCGTEFWVHDMPFDAFKKGEFDEEPEEEGLNI